MAFNQLLFEVVVTLKQEFLGWKPMPGSKKTTIRKVKISDASDIYALGLKSFKNFALEDWVFSFVAEYLETFQQYCFVAIQSGKLTGFLISKPFERSTKKFYIYWVAVSPNARRQGLGTRLIQKAIDAALDEGFTSIIIDTSKKNVSMQKLLEKMDFKVEDEEIFYIKKFKG